VGDRVRIKELGDYGDSVCLTGRTGIVIEMDTNEPEHEQMPKVELDGTGAKLIFWPSELEKE